jgi:hypothetical protein
MDRAEVRDAEGESSAIRTVLAMSGTHACMHVEVCIIECIPYRKAERAVRVRLQDISEEELKLLFKLLQEDEPSSQVGTFYSHP